MYAFTAVSGARVLLVDARPAYVTYRTFVPYVFARLATVLPWFAFKTQC